MTERAIACSIDCECPISAATSDSLLGSRYRAHTGQFTRTTPVLGSELASMSAIARTEDERGRGRDRAFTVNRTGDSPFCDCDCP